MLLYIYNIYASSCKTRILQKSIPPDTRRQAKLPEVHFAPKSAPASIASITWENVATWLPHAKSPLVLTQVLSAVGCGWS